MTRGVPAALLVADAEEELYAPRREDRCPYRAVPSIVGEPRGPLSVDTPSAKPARVPRGGSTCGWARTGALASFEGRDALHAPAPVLPLSEGHFETHADLVETPLAIAQEWPRSTGTS
jgi:hypothetical protein